MKRWGALLLAAAGLGTLVGEEANAQVMSVSACDTPSSRLAETFGIVPGADIEDGAFVVAAKSGCTVVPIRRDEHVLPQMNGAIDRARAGRNLSDRERVIVYVNGMAVTPEIQCESMRAIAAATGATVIGVHNATNGIAKDGLEVLAQRELVMQRRSGGPLVHLGRSQNPAVSTVRRIVIGSAVNGVKPPEIWAHSQGGVIASLALYEARDVLSKQGKSIDEASVVTFASAAPFFPSGPRYEHYVHTEDAVPRYTGLGRLGWFDDEKAGANARVIRFSGERFFPEKAPNAAAPDLSHHDILEIYVPRYLREHGGRPAALLTWSDR